MRLRALHLASLLLLVASLSTAETSVLRESGSSIGAHYLSVLLAQQDAAVRAPSPLDPRDQRALPLDLPSSSLASASTAWTMRPPSAHTLELHAVTGSSL